MKIINNEPIYEDEEIDLLANKFKKYWKEDINSKIGNKFFYIINKYSKEIEKFRLELGLGTEYFESKEQVLKWIDKEVKKIKNSQKGIKPIETIVPYGSYGLELKKGRNRSDPNYNKDRKTRRTVFNSLIEKRVKEFAAKIGLDNSWYIQFYAYLSFGKADMLTLTDCGIKLLKKLHSYKNKLPFEGKVVLELSPNTRLKDIQFIWGKQVKPLLESLPGFIKISPNKKVKRT